MAGAAPAGSPMVHGERIRFGFLSVLVEETGTAFAEQYSRHRLSSPGLTPARERVGLGAFPVSVRRDFGQPHRIELFLAAQSALRDCGPCRTGTRCFLPGIQPGRAGLGRPRPAAVLRNGATTSNGIPDRIHRRPRALPGLALLAPVRPLSGRCRGGLAGAERLSRIVSGDLGLALLAIVSRKGFGSAPRLVGLSQRFVHDQLVAARRVGVSLRDTLGRSRNGPGPFSLWLSLESAGGLPASLAAGHSDRVDHWCLRRFLSRDLVFRVARLRLSASGSATGVPHGLAGRIARALDGFTGNHGFWRPPAAATNGTGP